jgi:hypothetical protein
MNMGLLQDVERFWQMLLLDNCFVLFVITQQEPTWQQHERAASINMTYYYTIYIFVVQHTHQIKLEMLMIEN